MSTFDPKSLPDDGTESFTVDLSQTEASRPSTVIIETVLSLSRKDVSELDPLTDTVDPDALDNLFSYDSQAGESAVEFVVDEFSVTVREDGVIRFESLGGD